MRLKKKNRHKCSSGKVRFASEQETNRFIEDNNRGTGLFLIGYRLERSYCCDKCRGWHATAETLEQYELNLAKYEQQLA